MATPSPSSPAVPSPLSPAGGSAACRPRSSGSCSRSLSCGSISKSMSRPRRPPSSVSKGSEVIRSSASPCRCRIPISTASRSARCRGWRRPASSSPAIALDSLHNVTVTRVSRGDLIFTALPHLRLQFGDILQIVGDESSLESATKALGNEVQMIARTKFAAIFAGILLGVLLGLYPFRIEGLPAPVRLGLAGGPLVMAIHLGRFGRLSPHHASSHCRRPDYCADELGVQSGGRASDHTSLERGFAWPPAIQSLSWKTKTECS